jgi:aldose 1-epimerase
MNKITKNILLKFVRFIVVLNAIIILLSCNDHSGEAMKIKKEIFGKLSNGTEVDLFVLDHPNGAQVQFTNFGAPVVALKVPDKNGIIEDVVLGFDELEKYENIRGFYGAIVGRYGNRIAKGQFILDGNEYQTPLNDGENSLHGGFVGFDRVVWKVEDYSADKDAILKLSYLSKDGEEGYPGNLTVTVTYKFTLDLELVIDFEVSTDKKTVKNITNHAYFNLSGNVKDDILNHLLMLNADKYTSVVPGLIPTGEIEAVMGTPLDFRNPTAIGKRIDQDDEQLKLGHGYDHNWVINNADGKLNFAGTLYEPNSGRLMEIFTTEPGIQFYSGNFMDGSHSGHNGKVYKYRNAVCLETQHFPDSPNHPQFPSTTINPGETYKSRTVYKFSVK